MRKENNRLKTFQMNPPWPKNYIDIRKLAKAGFFYAFNGDNVHCAFCRGQVCKWEQGDDPMTEHARHFTTCPFIMGGDVGNEPLGEDPFPGPKRPRPYDVCGIFEPTEPIRDEQQQNNWHLYPIDFASNNTRTANPPQHLINNHNQSDYDNDRLYNHQSITYPPQSVQAAARSEYLSQISQMSALIPEQNNHQESTTSNNHDTCNSLISNSSGSSHHSSNSLVGICKICYTNAIELVFLPCGHSVSCISCAQRLHGCPFCRATIETRIRTYIV